MMIPTFGSVGQRICVAKVLSFAKQFPKLAPEGNLVSQKSLAKVGDFARIFCNAFLKHEDRLRARLPRAGVHQ
jgi:hypothetical protein